jgi:hypothetical protein
MSHCRGELWTWLWARRLKKDEITTTQTTTLEGHNNSPQSAPDTRMNAPSRYVDADSFNFPDMMPHSHSGAHTLRPQFRRASNLDAVWSPDFTHLTWPITCNKRSPRSTSVKGKASPRPKIGFRDLGTVCCKTAFGLWLNSSFFAHRHVCALCFMCSTPASDVKSVNSPHRLNLRPVPLGYATYKLEAGIPIFFVYS